MKVLAVVGVALEIVGLTLTALVLAATWRANAPKDEGFWARLRSDAVSTWQTLRGRHSVQIHSLSAHVTIGDNVSAVVTVDRSAWSVERRLDDLEERADKTGQDASRALADVERVESDLTRRIEELSTRVAELDQRQVEHERESVVSDVPLAAVGIGLAVFGQLLQVPAMLVS